MAFCSQVLLAPWLGVFLETKIMSGWIKLHRQLMEWEWYQDSNMVHLYLHMLMKANREPRKWKGVMVEAGQFIAGRETLSFDTGISVQTIRTCIARLQESGLLTSKPTNKYTLFTLVKWGSVVNGDDITNQQTNQQSTNNQPTTNQQLTTNKNIEKDKKDKNKKNTTPQTPQGAGGMPYTEILELYHEHCPSLPPVRNLNEQRKKLISQRLKQGYTIADFAQVFKNTEADDFMTGKNDRKWKANIDYILRDGKEDKFLKLLEATPAHVTPTEPEPQYFEPANRSEILKVFPNRTDLVDTPWSELTPDVQQVITEKCKEL